jgi:hypothetical protein
VLILDDLDKGDILKLTLKDGSIFAGELVEYVGCNPVNNSKGAWWMRLKDKSTGGTRSFRFNFIKSCWTLAKRTDLFPKEGGE